MPEFPNYDRDGRLRIFTGRGHDARGWALFQLKRNKEAVAALNDSVAAYASLPEGKRAAWHLATVKETIGEQREALDLYIAAYEPPSDGSSVDIKRSVIESLYKKVHGSVAGLNEKLGVSSAVVAASKEPARTTEPAPPTAAPPVESKAETKASTEEPPTPLPNGVGLTPSKVTNAMRGSTGRVRTGDTSRPPDPALAITATEAQAELPSVNDLESISLPSARINRLLLRLPFKRAAVNAPSPDSIQIEAGRPRRVSTPPPAPPEATPTRARRVERPVNN